MDFFTIYASLPLVFIAGTTLIMAYFLKRENSSYKYFICLCVVVLAWNIIQALFTSSGYISRAEFFFHLQMLFIPYVPVAFLMFVLRFSGFDRLSSAKYLVLACIIPTITVIMNFTNDFHNLFRINFAILQITPFRMFINERGPWFWVHTAYSYSAILATIFVSLYKVRGIVGASKLRYYMILLGSSLSVLANFFVLFAAPASPIDPTLWGVTFGLLFLYCAMDTSYTANYILVRNEVFEAISEYIFVLNMNGIITDINRPARNWLARHDIKTDPSTLRMLFDQLSEKGAIIEKEESTERWELFFPAKENSLFASYNIRQHYIYDSSQTPIGTIVTFSDMTSIRETLRSLQATSTVDVLTGAYNRRTYEKMLDDYEQKNTLPLCVIMGDVNGLKIINDEFGHMRGDQVLRCVTLLLVECTGNIGTVARIGGDEFAIILPGLGASAAEKLISDIKAIFKERAHTMMGAGIALGYAIKTEAHQDLSRIIDEADKKMYQDKQNDRRQRMANGSRDRLARSE